MAGRYGGSGRIDEIRNHKPGTKGPRDSEVTNGRSGRGKSIRHDDAAAAGVGGVLLHRHYAGKETAEKKGRDDLGPQEGRPGVTTGGIHGTVATVENDTILVKVSENIK